MAAHKNNFDFVRLTAALMVLFAHQFALLGRLSPAFGARLDPGALAVYTFFIVSGFLVAQSWTADPHAWRFVARRVLRIWPALIVATVVCALVLGPLVSTLPMADYFRSRQTYAYFSWLRVIPTYDLPGVFEHLPFPRAVNGSLWSVPLEVHWYIVLLVIGVIGLMRHRWFVVMATLGLAIYHFGVYHAETNKPQLTNQFGLFFCAGACLYLLQDFWMQRRIIISVVVSIIAAVIAMCGHQSLAGWICWPFVVIAFGTASTPYLRRVGRYGDFSYGGYVFAFPVQQTLVWATSGKWSAWQYLPVAAAATMALAFLSWHCIEKPALRLKPRRPPHGSPHPFLTLLSPLSWFVAGILTVLPAASRRRAVTSNESET